MENKRLKKLYDSHVNELVAFSEQADYLTEQSQRDYLGYRLKDFRNAVTKEHQREAFLEKGINRLYKLTLKEMKRELQLKRKKQRKEFFKLKVLKRLSGEKIITTEEICHCASCEHCFINEQGNTCCSAYNLEFQSIELNKQFVECFCTAYSVVSEEQPLEEESKQSEEAQEEQMPTAETSETLPEDEATSELPTCCCECEAYLNDENDEHYCNKYGCYLEASEVDSTCCCENDGFFDDEEN